LYSITKDNRVIFIRAMMTAIQVSRIRAKKTIRGPGSHNFFTGKTFFHSEKLVAPKTYPLACGTLICRSFLPNVL